MNAPECKWEHWRSSDQWKRGECFLWPQAECENCTAQGTEAQRATTVQQGVVHDGPVRAANAPNTIPSTTQEKLV